MVPKDSSWGADDQVIPDGVDHGIPDLVADVIVPLTTSFRQ